MAFKDIHTPTTSSLSQDKLTSPIREMFPMKTVNNIQPINLRRETSLCQRVKREGVAKALQPSQDPFPLTFTARPYRENFKRFRFPFLYPHIIFICYTKNWHKSHHSLFQTMDLTCYTYRRHCSIACSRSLTH